jgi:hypothetical protein
MTHSVKALQNGLARERERVKKLIKYDPVKMNKNLDDNKKRPEVAKAFKRPQALARFHRLYERKTTAPESASALDSHIAILYSTPIILTKRGHHKKVTCRHCTGHWDPTARVLRWFRSILATALIPDRRTYCRSGGSSGRNAAADFQGYPDRPPVAAGDD